jgi:hypothetical protein
MVKKREDKQTIYLPSPNLMENFPESKGTSRKIKRWSNTATHPLPNRNRWNWNLT